MVHNMGLYIVLGYSLPASFVINMAEACFMRFSVMYETGQVCKSVAPCKVDCYTSSCVCTLKRNLLPDLLTAFFSEPPASCNLSLRTLHLLAS
uniref:Putative secreted protein n=1 Tax=Amblyomma triste TaxID=251400 RepID=A0A023G1L2_AMBTT